MSMRYTTLLAPSSMAVASVALAVGVGWLIVHAEKPIFLILPLVAIPCVLAFWNYPVRAVYALVLLMPFEGYCVDLGLMNLSAVNVLIIVLTCIVLFKLRYFKKNLAGGWAVILFSLLLLIVISTLVSELQTGSLRFVITRIGSILTFALVFIVVSDFFQIKRSLMFVLVGALVSSVIVILASTDWAPLMKELLGPIRSHGTSAVAGIQTQTVRTSATFGTYASYGVWIELIYPLLLISVFTREGPISNRSLAVFSVAFITLAVFLAQSRSTWLAVLVSIAWALLLMVKGRKLRLIVVALSLFSLLLTYSPAVELVVMVRDMRVDTVYNRLAQYSYAFELFLENPVFGIGRDGFTRVFFNDYLIYKTLHNNFLAVLIAHGLVTFIPYIGLIFVCLYCLYMLTVRARDEGDRLLACGLFAGFVGILTEIQFAEYLAGKGLWLMMGLACRSYLILRKKRIGGRRRVGMVADTSLLHRPRISA